MQCLWRFLVIITFVVGSDGRRIVGGWPAKQGEFPYQVSLRRSYNDNLFCGGSIISESYVLTAAHCVHNILGMVYAPHLISVFAGEISLKTTKNTVFKNLTKIIPHPGYNENDKTMRNDIALLQVNTKFSFGSNPNIAPVALPTKEYTTGSCVVSGWGRTGSDTSLPVVESLLVTNVEIVNFEKCQEMYSKDKVQLYKESMCCAGHIEGKTDACQGDSGGPLVCFNELFGVVSTGKGCAQREYPGIYAYVYNFLDWISKNTIEESPEESTTEKHTSVAPSEEAIYEEILKYLEKILNKSVAASANFYLTLLLVSAIKMLLN